MPHSLHKYAYKSNTHKISAKQLKAYVDTVNIYSDYRVLRFVLLLCVKLISVRALMAGYDGALLMDLWIIQRSMHCSTHPRL